MIQQVVTEEASVSKDVGMPLAVDSSASSSDSSTVSRNSNNSPPNASTSTTTISNPTTQPTKSTLPLPISVPSPMGAAPVKDATTSSTIPKISPQLTTTADATTMSMPSTTHARTAVPDPISSSAGWSGIGTTTSNTTNTITSNTTKNDDNNSNANVHANANGNGNTTNNMLLKNVPKVSVGVNSNTTNVSSPAPTTTPIQTPVATHQVVKTQGQVQPQAQAQPASQQQQQQRGVAQIASRGGIRHNIGSVKRESIPVPVPITVTSNPITTSSSHVTPMNTSTGTTTPMPLQSIHNENTVTVSVTGSTVPAAAPVGGNMTNTHFVNNPNQHMDHTKKSPRLEGMEDKSSMSMSLSLPDPTSVPNTCSSSVSTSSSNTGTTMTVASSSATNTSSSATIPAPTASTGITLSSSIGISSVSSAPTAHNTMTTTATAAATTAPLSSLSPQYPPMAQMSSTVGHGLQLGVGVLHSSSALLATNPPDRKQKRLQRNRESARLSRRRRKQYLEVLEERVNFLCEEMDRGRREHVLSALSNIRAMRTEVMNVLVEGVMASTSNNFINQEGPDTVMGEGGMISQDLYQKMNMLLDFRDATNQTSGLLSRMSSELMLAITFGREYLKSLVIPPSKKYIMWLTLQNDTFFRGGRAASERLSAARIGEKLRSCGHTQVPPCNGMWPLFCNEVSLSYDQEEKIRALQREILSNQDTWLDRHTSAASEHLLTSSHDAIRGAAETTERRGSKLMNVLSQEQKIRLMAWIAKKKRDDGKKLVKILEACKLSSTTMDESGDENFQVEATRHNAANLYILNHRLGKIAQKLPFSKQGLPSDKALKKFTRRPAFESLATMEDSKGGESTKKGRKMSKDLSTSSLKRSSSEMTMDGTDNGSFMKRSTSGASLSGSLNTSVTPEVAQSASANHVIAALGPISSLIPSNRLARPTTSTTQTRYVLPSTISNEIPLMPDHAVQHQIPATTVQGHPALVAHNTLPIHTTTVPQQVTSQPTSTPTVTRSVSFSTINTATNNQPTFSFSIPDPVPVVPQQQQQQMTYEQTQPLSQPQPQPALVSSQSAPLLRQNNVPSPLVEPMASIKEELPNVPLDDINFWGVSNQVADDSLFELTEEDWAIGEALF